MKEVEGVDRNSKLRLFVALSLPDSWREQFAHVRAELERVAPGELRWVRPELLHLTLVFLGYQPVELLPSIKEALGAAGSEASPFSLTLGNVGCFGPPHSIHVVWVGLAEIPPQLQQLHNALTRELSTRNLSFDQKPLVPHITLARGRRPVDRTASLRIHSAMQRARVPTGLIADVGRFVLMQSHLSRLGPDYEVVASFVLGG